MSKRTMAAITICIVVVLILVIVAFSMLVPPGPAVRTEPVAATLPKAATSPEDLMDSPPSANSLKITVIDEAGQPVADAEVVLLTQPQHDENGRTNASGVALVNDLPPGPAVLMILQPHPAATAEQSGTPIVFSGRATIAGPTTLAVTAHKPVEVRGVVTGNTEDGNLVLVNANHLPGADNAHVARDGTFQITALPGDYKVYVATPGSGFKLAFVGALTVPDSGVQDATLAITPDGPTISVYEALGLVSATTGP